MNKISWTVGMLLFAGACAAAPTRTTIQVGDKDVSGTFIQPYSVTWKPVGVGPDHSVKEMGTWTDSVSVVDLNGRAAIRRRQTWSHDGGAETYINFVDRKTMAPIMSQYVNSVGIYYRFEYGPDSKIVRFQRSPFPTDHPKQTDAATPMEQAKIEFDKPVFDFNSGMFGLLIAGFPLRQGYSARFPVTNMVDPRKPAWIDFQIVGKESVVPGPGRAAVQAWLAIVNSPATGEVMRIDLTKQAPYIVRLRQEWAGRDWTFVML